MTKTELELRHGEVEKEYKHFLEGLGSWGSGADPFGNTSTAGIKQMKALETQRTLAATMVGCPCMCNPSSLCAQGAMPLHPQLLPPTSPPRPTPRPTGPPTTMATQVKKYSPQKQGSAANSGGGGGRIRGRADGSAKITKSRS